MKKLVLGLFLLALGLATSSVEAMADTFSFSFAGGRSPAWELLWLTPLRFWVSSRSRASLG